jgi:ribosomal protein L7/L12
MPEPTEEQIREITDALQKGRKIEAIKVYREATGLGLKEAKEFIEELTATLREKHPDKMPAAKAGCASVFLLIGVLLVVLVEISRV